MTRWHDAQTLLLILILVLTLPFLAVAQTSVPQHKVFTADQAKYQAQLEEWRNKNDDLKTKANQALKAELQRAKNEDKECADAVTTYDIEQCLNREIVTTQENYRVFTSALRLMLGHASPEIPGEKPYPVLTPTAAQNVAEFDRLEAQSEKYRDIAVQAAYNQYAGGTLAPVFAGEVKLKLLRMHLQELAYIYGDDLSDH